MHNKRRRPLAALLAALVAIGVLLAGGATPAYAKPAVGKNLTPNGDGTYTLSLSVTGDASSSSSSSKANVVVVFDTSGSMGYDYTFKPTSAKRDVYGRVNGQYVPLNYHNNWLYGEYWTDGYGSTYTGQRYERVQLQNTRMQTAQDATKGLVEELLKKNVPNTDMSDAVEIALVPFSSRLGTETSWTTDKRTLDTAIDGYTPDGGTNWETALKRAEEMAKAKSADGDATYVIFVSDGDPTFRDSLYWRYANDHGAGGRGYEDLYGTGNSDPNGWNFGAAQDYAKTITETDKFTMFSVGAFGDTENMTKIGGTYYDASDGDALNAAFADIISNITNGLSYKDVVVTDNLTSLTSAIPAGSTATDFTYTYTKDGKPYTPDADHKPGDATLNGSQVNWPFGGITLEKGVTYTVSFKVWPSQAAYDLLADLNNGKKSYDSLSDAEKDMVVKKDDGTYTLRTNTPSGNELTYTKVETTTVNGETTTKETKDQKVEITNRPDMGLTGNQVSVKKEWPNTLDERTGTGNVVLTVSSDAASPEAVDVTLQPTGYEGSVYVAPGIMTGSAENGWTIYDTGHDYTMTEKSSDNGYYWEFSAETYHPMLVNGELKMLVKKAGGQYTINGATYAEASGTAALTAKNIRRSNVNLKKVVTAADGVTAPADAEFKFNLTVTDANGDDVWYSIDNGQSQSFTSGSTVEVTLKADQNLRIFNLPTGSSYTFEELDADMPKGFSFVKAVDADGKEGNSKSVTGSVTVPNTSTTVTYTNSYDKVTLSSDTKNALQATKKVTGADAIEQFSFTLAAKDDATKKAVTDGDVVMPKDATATTETEGNIKKDGKETVDFGDVTFYKEGTYTFTVDETTTTATNGWTYDDSVKDVTVVVAKNAQTGKLEAAVTGNNPTFTNAYHETKLSEDTKNPVQVKKTVTGASTSASFSFTLTAGDDATAKAVQDGVITLPGAAATEGAFTAGETKTVSFGDVVFRAKGDYKFNVTENITTVPAGWSYDKSTKTVAVKVDQDDKTGDLTAKITSDVPEFKNSYSADPATLNTTAKGGIVAQKLATAAEGTMWASDNATFSFTLKPAGQLPATVKAGDAELTADGITGTATVEKSGEPVPVDFGTLEFSAAGIYNFTIQEVVPEQTSEQTKGWTYAEASQTVTVKVSDDGEGKLYVESIAPGTDDKAATFGNSYDVTPLRGDTAVKLSVNKTLTGTTLAAGQFKFELTPTTEGDTNAAQTKTNDAKGTVAFDGLEYTKPGVYKYTISEKNENKKGYTYDKTSAEVTVTVTDNGDGTMSADVKYSKTEFKNSYKATGSTKGDASIYAQKNLTGRTLEADQFKFELKDSEGKVLQTKTNDASGRVVFDAITYDQSIFDEAASTTEDDKDKDSTTEDNKSDATESDSKSDDAAKDEAKPESDSTEDASKPADSESTNGADEEKTDAADESAEVATTEEPAADPEANPASALVDALSSLVETPANAAEPEQTARTKTFTYTISEVAGDKAGYTYDTHVETVTVTVTDNGDGTLGVTTAYDQDGAVFNNSYTASGETGDSVKATKTLTGRDMTEGEFEFALLDAAGNEVATGKNAADGSVTFSSIKYDQTQVGDHEYTMVEKGGSATGVTYDTAKKPVKVTVTDKGDGTLTTAVDYSDGNTFTNVYKPLSTSGYLNAKKVLNGRDLVAGEFSFEVLDKDGNVVAKGTNDADGTVRCEGLPFDAVGDYEFQVREVRGDDSTITYDDSTHTYTFHVEDVDGQLSVTSVKADGKDEAAVFTNTYTEPETPVTPEDPATPASPSKPAPSTPAKQTKSAGKIAKTGDTTTSVVGIVIAGAVIVAGGVFLRKRNSGAKR